MVELHDSVNKFDVPSTKDLEEKDFWLAEYLSPEIVQKELTDFLHKPIPEELAIYNGFGLNDVIIELFVINGTPHKTAYYKEIYDAGAPERERLAKELFDRKKANGSTSLDKVFEYNDPPFVGHTTIIEPSGESNNEWFTLPIAKVLAMGEAAVEFNPCDVKVGDLVRLHDSMVWKADNPVYLQYINHADRDMKGVRQTSKPPMRFTYNALSSQGMARDAFNINPLNYKNNGFVYKKKVTEISAVLSIENLLKYTEL